MYPPVTLTELLATASKTGFNLNAPTPVEWLAYTGLKDVNGVDIFVNDIVKDHLDGALGKIVFAKGAYHVEWLPAHQSWVNYGSEYLYDINKLEVIGNVYENPELLSQEAINE